LLPHTFFFFPIQSDADPIIPPGPVGETKEGQLLYEVEQVLEKREVKHTKKRKNKSNPNSPTIPKEVIILTNHHTNSNNLLHAESNQNQLEYEFKIR
jgi:hypothetical protein